MTTTDSMADYDRARQRLLAGFGRLGEGGLADLEMEYHAPLPPDLARWHLYLVDGGHCIAVALTAWYTPGGDWESFLCPAPVKSVLRAGYRVDDGYIVADLPYDEARGLVTSPEDDEPGPAMTWLYHTWPRLLSRLAAEERAGRAVAVERRRDARGVHGGGRLWRLLVAGVGGTADGAALPRAERDDRLIELEGADRDWDLAGTPTAAGYRWRIAPVGEGAADA